MKTLNTDVHEDNAKSPNESSAKETFAMADWTRGLDGFHQKATTIRRMLMQFYGADLSTRRYLQHHLDEEFADLKASYDSLSAQFVDSENRYQIDSENRYQTDSEDRPAEDAENRAISHPDKSKNH